ISDDLSSPFITALAQKYDVVCQGELWKTPKLLKQKIREARAIMIRNQTQVTAQLLAAAPQLAAIGRVGVGLDNIDVSAATDLGIVVVAPLEANAVSVAELTIGVILALARRLPLADRSTRSRRWDGKGRTGLALH